MVLRCFTTSEKVTNKKTTYHWCCKAPTYVDYAVVTTGHHKVTQQFFNRSIRAHVFKHKLYEL